MERSRQDQADAALLEDVRGTIPESGLQARERDAPEPESVLIEVRRLRGVADPHLDVIDAVERHVVLTRGAGGGPGGGLGRHRLSSSSGAPFMIRLFARGCNTDSLCS